MKFTGLVLLIAMLLPSIGCATRYYDGEHVNVIVVRPRREREHHRYEHREHRGEQHGIHVQRGR